MNTLLRKANRYVETSDWKTISVLKVCTISLGLMAGMAVKPEHKKAVYLGAACAFGLTYVPLMVKLYNVFTEEEFEEE